MRGYWDKRIGGESIFVVIIVFLAIWDCYKVNGVVYVLYPLKGDILGQLIIVQSGVRGLNLLPRWDLIGLGIKRQQNRPLVPTAHSESTILPVPFWKQVQTVKAVYFPKIK